MTAFFHVAAAGSIAVAAGYVLGVLLIIGVLWFIVVKAFGHSLRGRWYRRSSLGAGEEVFDPDDGTPHRTDG